MHREIKRMVGAGLTASLWVVGVGCASEVHVEMGALSSALSAPGVETNALTQELTATPGTSHLLPQIDGMRLTLQGNISLCRGNYGENADCSASVLRFDEPIEVELMSSGGVLSDLAELGTAGRVAAGEFDFAEVRLSQRYAIKAQFSTDDGTVYTTSQGLRLASAGARVGNDYDYLEQDALYPQFADDPDVTETTYFPVPFAYDGSSALTIRLLVDLRRAGRFSAASTDARFEPAYLNVYVSAASDLVEDVHTYVLANEAEALAEPASAAMTLVFSGAQTLLGGRVRFASDLGREGLEALQQFLARWSCEGELCSFVVGDYGTGEFGQTASGFRLLDVGEPASTFTLETSSGRRELHYERVAD